MFLVAIEEGGAGWKARGPALLWNALDPNPFGFMIGVNAKVCPSASVTMLIWGGFDGVSSRSDLI